RRPRVRSRPATPAAPATPGRGCAVGPRPGGRAAYLPVLRVTSAPPWIPACAGIAPVEPVVYPCPEPCKRRSGSVTTVTIDTNFGDRRRARRAQPAVPPHRTPSQPP